MKSVCARSEEGGWLAFDFVVHQWQVCTRPRQQRLLLRLLLARGLAMAGPALLTRAAHALKISAMKYVSARARRAFVCGL